MSALVPVTGIPQRSVSADLTTTDRTVLLDNDSAYLFAIVSLALSNDDANAATLRLETTRDDADFTHVWFGTVPASDTVDTAKLPLPIFLFPGERLVATASAANRLLVHLNYLMGTEQIGA